MKKWNSKMLALSLAGHDKGTWYVVLEENTEGGDGAEGFSEFLLPEDGVILLLADGKRRTLDHPKKKKAKHVQLVTHLPEPIGMRMKEITLDAHVRKILKEYREYQAGGCEEYSSRNDNR